MTNGSMVREFELAFADYVGAKYAIAFCNGTATLHAALVALGVGPGIRVAVPPLTMASTTLAVLHAGGIPIYEDIYSASWLQCPTDPTVRYRVPVDLYGLQAPLTRPMGYAVVTDAAQTLRRRQPHDATLDHGFVSYSFQASKILATGEGGMLVTDSEELATIAREFGSLGYRMRATQPRIDPAVLKSPAYARHHRVGWNYRMNDVTAAEGLRQLTHADALLARRRACAERYAEVVTDDCPWLVPQCVPGGYAHDWWAYAVAADTPARAVWLMDAIVRHGGERPYAAWRLTYREPALLDATVSCPHAESLQPRLLQFQTNDLPAATRNAHALRLAIAHAETLTPAEAVP
jgi:perosamine synthetase